MDIHRFPIAGPALLRPKLIEDPRGYFFEAFRQEWFDEIAPGIAFVQDNQSLSRRRGTIRGLHFQRDPRAQGKLIRVLRGSIYDVAVDIRAGSPTFAQHVAVELSEGNKAQFWIPAGFAHGFCTLEADTEVLYKSTDTYSPSHDAGILWSDARLGIKWPVAAADALLSDRDNSLPLLEALPPMFEL